MSLVLLAAVIKESRRRRRSISLQTASLREAAFILCEDNREQMWGNKGKETAIVLLLGGYLFPLCVLENVSRASVNFRVVIMGYISILGDLLLRIIFSAP